MDLRFTHPLTPLHNRLVNISGKRGPRDFLSIRDVHITLEATGRWKVGMGHLLQSWASDCGQLHRGKIIQRSAVHPFSPIRPTRSVFPSCRQLSGRRPFRLRNRRELGFFISPEITHRVLLFFSASLEERRIGIACSATLSTAVAKPQTGWTITLYCATLARSSGVTVLWDLYPVS
ncbi:hypothetical protein DM02DRAFT_1809 [Periconia macrospinosa]|uniref:Uncharacterized protein n=1 Tax=Periconia macrospinosa TaxID=97972 RepID=A0A2V1ECV4_9PLEO|nr:hypothetical protein DM02DRAFT_1809 [Periconia macrospinosa]